MSRIKRTRPSPAILIAVLALVAALAGTAVAGPDASTSISRKATKKIAKKEAKKQDKKQNKKNFPVGTSQIANSAVTGAKLADNELTYNRSDIVSVAAGADGSAIAVCPSGTSATGGGGAYPAASMVQILQSNPSNGTVGQAGFTAWEIRIRNGAAVPRNLRAYVICAKKDTTGNYTPGAATP